MQEQTDQIQDQKEHASVKAPERRGEPSNGLSRRKLLAVAGMSGAAVVAQELLANRVGYSQQSTGSGTHDKLYARKTTIAEIGSGMFPVGTILKVSDRGDTIFDVVAGGVPNGLEIVDAGSGKTAVARLSRAVSPKAVGASGGVTADASVYINRLLNLGFDVDCSDDDYRIDNDVIIPSHRTIRGSRSKTFIANGRLCLGIKNSTGEWVASIAPLVYFKQEHYTANGYSRNEITSGVLKKASHIPVQDTSLFSAGDYVYLSNGYADMWRVLSNTSISGIDYLRPHIDLWKAEIHRIRGISGNTLIIDGVLGFDCPLVPKTYGLIPNENSSAASVGFTTPNVEKLVGAKNIRIESLHIVSGNHTPAIFGIGCENVTVSDVTIDAETNTSEEQISFHTSINCKVIGCTARSLGFSVSIRRASTGCLVTDSVFSTGGGADSAVNIWEGAYGNIASNLNIFSFGEPSKLTRGVYFNSSHDNTADNITGHDLLTTINLAFLGSGSKISNIKSVNCDMSFSSYRAFEFNVDGVNHTGFHTLAGNNLAKGFMVENYDCNTFSISNAHQTDLEFTGFVGAFRNVLCLNSHLHNIIAPKCVLYDPIEASRTYRPELVRMDVTDSLFYSGDIRSETFNLSDTRASKYKNTKFLNGFSIKFSHYTEFKDCEFGGTHGAMLDLATFTIFEGCRFRCTGSAVHFGTNPSINRCNIKFRNCMVEAPAYFTNYSDNEPNLVGGNVSPFARGGEEVDILTNYPIIKTYKNTNVFGNQAGWLLV
ncbi:right-handed parallel beta-helix repeat-containing protein [Paenibacillus oceani]|uniref:Right handed beta helix domain-containing protein n=1 Tax=Paenibacillus oceani TaxID=2772510 RepID=A0A927GZE0_9BACL|nr:hypothetical protein [Paenibacillus oceani]MBD2862550.1 hypothetical protein [Paenibacillus oceani]